MPNAAAHFDDDLAIEKPRRKAARRAAGSKKKGRGRFHLKLNPKKVARYGAIALCAGVVVGIMVNALVLQKGRHPAPLFGKSIALGEASAPRPIKRAAIETPVETPLPAAKPALPTQVAIPDDEATPSGDAIGRLIQGGPASSDHHDPKVVSGAQRALIKLGYVVKATGAFGPQTKKALETFEKDRHLPVNGELSRRVIKILAAESGLKIEH